MPIYEFRCVECGHIQEFIVTGSDKEVVMKCDECQAEDMERVLSQVNYAMGSSGAAPSRETCPSATTRSCGSGNSCTTVQLPGHTR